MTPFYERAYQLLRLVPAGRVTTYKELADALGTKAYRAIGQAMRNNPYAPEVPCHRVVGSDGRIGGFMGSRQADTVNRKTTLLSDEGVTVENGRVMHFETVLFRFNNNVE